jgi:hypothetical protein
MPKNKIKNKSIEDKFYTHPDVAKKCYEMVKNLTNDCDFFIEPSAGNGSFFNIITHSKVGYDISPESNNIIKGSWFEQQVPKDCVVIGNPPFGNRNDLTKAFIGHAINNAKIIAFVLPLVFRKETMQKSFPVGWKLILDYTLPMNSFVLDSEPYHVPCCFQIWSKYDIGINLRESVKGKIFTNDFTFVTIKNLPRYFIFGAAPKNIIKVNDVLKNNRGYYINVVSEDVIINLQKIDWNTYSLSSVSGNVAWFTKEQIINIYCKEYGSDGQINTLDKYF